MSLHIKKNNFAKKRGIGKKIILTVRAIMQDEHVNLIAGDFNGAACRQTSGNNPHHTNTLEEAIADADFPTPPGPTPLWCLGAIPGEWADVCGFIVIPNSQDLLKVRLHGAFTIPEKSLVSVKETRAATMKSGCIRTSLATDTLSDHE